MSKHLDYTCNKDMPYNHPWRLIVDIDMSDNGYTTIQQFESGANVEEDDADRYVGVYEDDLLPLIDGLIRAYNETYVGSYMLEGDRDKDA